MTKSKEKNIWRPRTSTEKVRMDTALNGSTEMVSESRVKAGLRQNKGPNILEEGKMQKSKDKDSSIYLGGI